MIDYITISTKRYVNLQDRERTQRPYLEKYTNNKISSSFVSGEAYLDRRVAEK